MQPYPKQDEVPASEEKEVSSGDKAVGFNDEVRDSEPGAVGVMGVKDVTLEDSEAEIWQSLPSATEQGV